MPHSGSCALAHITKPGSLAAQQRKSYTHCMKNHMADEQRICSSCMFFDSTHQVGPAAISKHVLVDVQRHLHAANRIKMMIGCGQKHVTPACKGMCKAAHIVL